MSTDMVADTQNACHFVAHTDRNNYLRTCKIILNATFGLSKKFWAINVFIFFPYLNYVGPNEQLSLFLVWKAIIMR